MTELGGANFSLNAGCIFSIDTNGTEFKKMLDFNVTNGENPFGNLTVFGNMLYGMAAGGGINGNGIVFKIDTSTVASINSLSQTTNAITLFPNPNNGIFTIQSSVVSGQSSVEIYNVMGQKVNVATLKPVRTIYPGGQVQCDYKLDISSQPSGVYFYRVLNNVGGVVGEGKFVVTH